MGPGQGFSGEEVPHFDRLEHLRTQENHDRRQRARRVGVEVEEGMGERGTLGNFLWVGGVVLLGVSVPLVLAGRVMGGGRKEDRAQ
jgi:hypothetical protein